jgi:hypothetical protein
MLRENASSSDGFRGQVIPSLLLPLPFLLIPFLCIALLTPSLPLRPYSIPLPSSPSVSLIPSFPFRPPFLLSPLVGVRDITPGKFFKLEMLVGEFKHILDTKLKTFRLHVSHLKLL